MAIMGVLAPPGIFLGLLVLSSITSLTSAPVPVNAPPALAPPHLPPPEELVPPAPPAPAPASAPQPKQYK